MVQVRECMLFRIRADSHRAELEHSEPASTQTGSILSEEHRTWGIQFYSQRNEEKNGRKQHQTQRRPNEVDNPLDGNRRRLEHRSSELEERLILMPDEGGPNSGNFHGACRIEQLAAGSETRFANARYLLIVEMLAHHHRFGLVCVYDIRQLPDGTHAAVEPSSPDGHVACEGVIPARCQHRPLQLMTRLTPVSNKKSRSRPARPRPDLAQEVLGEAAYAEQDEPGCRNREHIHGEGAHQVAAAHQLPENEPACESGGCEKPNFTVQATVPAVTARENEAKEKKRSEYGPAVAPGDCF